MEPRVNQKDFEDIVSGLLSRLQAKQFFRSNWDITSFAVWFIFVGTILLFVILVLVHCCCCCCCCCCCNDEKPRRSKVGTENVALEP